MPPSLLTSRRLDVATAVTLCGFGAALRAPGLSSRDPWFDDAWAELPVRVPFSTALHMVVTTPLYTIALRWWVDVRPSHLWWAQLPALVLGIAGIAAVYGLVRSLGFSWLAAVGAGLAIAAGPIAIAYSTRLKEYPFDLLAACLVLWLADRWRTQPSRRRLEQLAAASVAGLWVSASTAAVVGGAATVVVAVAWSRRELRRDALGLVAALAVGSAALWIAFLRRVPAQLRTNWRTHGYLFGYSSARHVVFEFQQTFSGLSHGLFGVPIPYTSTAFQLRALPMTLAVATFLLVVAIVVPPIVGVVRSRGARVGPTFASAAAMVLAVLGTAVGASPLGDGRTDEVLYPSLLVLAVGAATTVARRGTATPRTRDVARVATGVAVAVVAVWFGVTHVAAYPPTGLRTVVAELRPKLLPGDLVVVDGYESFTWADDNLSAWRVSFAQGAVPWPMGFHVVSEDPTYVFSTNYLQSDEQIDSLAKVTRRIWYVGPTVGGFSTAAPKAWWRLQFSTPTVDALSAFGWAPVVTTLFQTEGVYAELYVYRPHPAASVP